MNPHNSQAKIPSTRYALAYRRHTRQIRPTRQSERFRHSLAGIAQRRADGVLNPEEQSIREEIPSGLLADKGGEAADQHRHACAGRDHCQ